MNTYDPQTPPSDFIDGFAAGAELSRQAAFEAWLRFSAFQRLTAARDCSLELLRKEQELQGFDNGVKWGRQYAGKPEQPKPMTAEQHNKFPKGRWT